MGKPEVEKEERRLEKLHIIWESIGFYEIALRERILKNNVEGLDLPQTKMLYRKLIEELKLYGEALDVNLDEADKEFFDNYFNEKEDIEGTVAFLESTWGWGTGDKARKYINGKMLEIFERRYTAIDEYDK